MKIRRIWRAFAAAALRPVARPFVTSARPAYTRAARDCELLGCIASTLEAWTMTGATGGCAGTRTGLQFL